MSLQDLGHLTLPRGDREVAKVTAGPADVVQLRDLRAVGRYPAPQLARAAVPRVGCVQIVLRGKLVVVEDGIDVREAIRFPRASDPVTMIARTRGSDA
jgi:hypothetical protein